MTEAPIKLVEKSVRSRRPRFNFVGLATLLIALAMWQVVAVTGPLADTDALPSPVEVGEGFAQLIDRGVLLDDLAHTVYVTVQASAIGISIGLVLSVFANQIGAQSLGAAALHPALMAAVGVSVLLTTIAAALLPAGRAARIDPQHALREE